MSTLKAELHLVMYDGQTGGRIDQIQQMEKKHNFEFYHVPGKHNIADMVTRQTSKVAVVLSERWTQGGFLKQDFDGWQINKKKNYQRNYLDLEYCLPQVV